MESKDYIIYVHWPRVHIATTTGKIVQRCQAYVCQGDVCISVGRSCGWACFQDYVYRRAPMPSWTQTNFQVELSIQTKLPSTCIDNVTHSHPIKNHSVNWSGTAVDEFRISSCKSPSSVVPPYLHNVALVYLCSISQDSCLSWNATW